MAARFVVVAGTDTGVGKTFVSVALCRALVRAGRRVVAVKPLESGCSDETLAGEDGALLAAATGQAAPRRALVRLRAAVTPALAADLEGTSVDVAALSEPVRQLGAGADVVLVEGAGGLLSPLSWDEDVTDVARLLEASVLLVGSDRLGVLHHARAALEATRARGLAIAGLVLSGPETADASTGTNADALRRVLPQAALGAGIVTVPRTSVASEAEAPLAPLVAWLASARQ